MYIIICKFAAIEMSTVRTVSKYIPIWIRCVVQLLTIKNHGWNHRQINEADEEKSLIGHCVFK